LRQYKLVEQGLIPRVVELMKNPHFQHVSMAGGGIENKHSTMSLVPGLHWILQV
jgi:hypothetical protein